MPDKPKPLCPKCYIPYESEDRGCCSTCYTMQLLNLRAIIMLPPGNTHR